MASVASESTSKKRKGTPNRRWTKDMDDVLIPCLAEQAKAGMKVDKSFKRVAFVEAARVVNNKIPGSNMDADNVENRLRTLKTKYQDLKKVMGLSGVGWRDSTKMLVLEDESYRTYVESHPKAKDWLNKPIPHYDDLRIVCGDDHATGEFARSIFDRIGSDDADTEGNNEPPTEFVEPETEPEADPPQRELPRHTSSTSTARTGRASRQQNDNFFVEHFSEKFDRLSASIEGAKPKPWKDRLSEALWSMEGYSDDDLEMVFELLTERKNLAQKFYLRKPNLRKKWLDNFIAQHRGSE